MKIAAAHPLRSPPSAPNSVQQHGKVLFGFDADVQWKHHCKVFALRIVEEEDCGKEKLVELTK
jgi:hypothetical protein